MDGELRNWLVRNLGNRAVVFGTIARGVSFQVHWDGDRIEFLDRNVSSANQERIQTILGRAQELGEQEAQWVTTNYGNNWEGCPNTHQSPFIARIVLAFLFNQDPDEFEKGRNGLFP